MRPSNTSARIERIRHRWREKGKRLVDQLSTRSNAPIRGWWKPLREIQTRERTRSSPREARVAPPRTRPPVTTALDTGPNADKQRTHAPCVAILRWNRSTAGTEAAGPICAPAAAACLGNDAAAHGRESARRAEADAATSRGLVGAAGDTGVEEERDLTRRRAEATLYMQVRGQPRMGLLGCSVERGKDGIDQNSLRGQDKQYFLRSVK
jgi:hypothetical protein